MVRKITLHYHEGSKLEAKFIILREANRRLRNTYVYIDKNAFDDQCDVLKQLEKSGASVPNFVSLLFGKGYHLHLDNCYASKQLAQNLLDNKNSICKTVMLFITKLYSLVCF